MGRRPTAMTDWRAYARRLAGMIVLGALLAGCDRCGDWVSPLPGSSQVCRQDAPKPQ